MGRRSTGADKVYAAAEVWIERALRTEDSLFTPGDPIWNKETLETLRRHFINMPAVPGARFDQNLKRQLEGSPPEVYQLMAEVLYIHLLFIWEGKMKGATKKKRIDQILKWSGRPVTIPRNLVDGMTPGIGNPGVAFLAHRHIQIGYLIDFANRWKETPPNERHQSLIDPWTFKRSLHFEPATPWLKQAEAIYSLQREALLHLVYPNTFEKVISTTHKSQIVDAFAQMVIEPTEDVDRRVQQIRVHLEAEYGKGFDFYDDPINSMWDPVENQKAWDRFVNRARAFVEAGVVDSEENDYKVEIGRKLEQARKAVLTGGSDWVDLVKGGLTGNIIYPIQLAKLKDWVTASPDKALRSLQAIWTRREASVPERIRSFLELLPLSVISGPGTRTTVTSQILMGVDVYRYPPFRITLFNNAYDQVGYPRPNKDAEEPALYEHALGFLDRFIQEAAERGVELRHRLDAQSLVWMILTMPPPKENSQPGHTDPPIANLKELATKLHLTVAFLEEIETLLKEKRQVVFQGPPGTGKTYVAQRLAEQLAGSKDRVTLVQFHPSYAYEDFVQGYRPSLLEGQPGFELKDGPLLQAARRAEEDPDGDHYLVIDEINRGNLAKVFGELYFLLEYRNERMRLQYQADKEFSLPENLYIIGTMNTADRSIALVDLALRRRFYFVEFHPDDEPIKGLLRNWLLKKASHMEWVADIINLANKKLEKDRHVAIGPSYFMGTDESGNAVVRDETSVRRIWKHSVRPYIEEHLFGNRDGMNEWDLDKLMQQVKAPTSESDGDAGTSSKADASD
ncbi:MAG: AAA family ATPase [bacterium]|nr:AAA family ATPase [bacterium]